MKNLLFASILLGITVGAGLAQVPSRALYDSSAGRYDVEDGAKIVVAVENDAFGQVLVDLWNANHPEALDAVGFVTLSAEEMTQRLVGPAESAPDVVMAPAVKLFPLADRLAAIDGNLVEQAYQNLDRNLYKLANAKFRTLAALPFAYDGMLFAWNKTMLAALGYDVQAASDNLPALFDTWEKIFALSKEWQTKRPVYQGQPVNLVFSVSLAEVRSSYFWLSAGGWQIFKEENPWKPGFEKAEFLRGIEFLKAAADARISVTTNGTLTPSSALPGASSFLDDQSSPFGLVGTGTDVEAAMAQGGQDLQFSRLPTWRGIRPDSLLSVNVAAVNGFTRFPSASSELLRLLFTKDGMQAVVDHSPYLPPLLQNAKISPDYSASPSKAQRLLALASSLPEPASLWLVHPGKPAVAVLEDADVIQILKEVWDGARSPSDGQKAITAAGERWAGANKAN